MDTRAAGGGAVGSVVDRWLQMRRVAHVSLQVRGRGGEATAALQECRPSRPPPPLSLAHTHNIFGRFTAVLIPLLNFRD